MSNKRTLVRVPTKLMDDYVKLRSELVGLTYSAIAEVMLREALDKQKEVET